MKKFISVFIVSALLAGLVVSACAIGYVSFSGDCNVRRGPGLDYGTMGAVKPGTTLDYAGDCSYDDRGVAWYSVYYQGAIGWVSSRYAILHNSGSYDYDDEPYVPLIVPQNGWGEWKKYDNDILSMRIKVTNVSSIWTIKAFQIYMYAEDVWGDRIYGEDIVYYNTTTKSVAPGETVYCDYINMPQRNRISKVYAGVKKVIFTDGTIRENSVVDYTSWTIS